MRLLLLLLATSTVFAASVKVDVNIMPSVVFTGDSQTCGRVGALDYPQMLSWELPIRVINTGVGGTNTRHLLSDTSGGVANATKGEKVVHGAKVGWWAGPYPGQRIRLGRQTYTVDRIEVVSYKDRKANIWITEPAKEDFEGRNYSIEAGWRVRVAERKPDYVCCMYSVNDAGWSSEAFRKQLDDIYRRTRALGAQLILLSGVPLMDAAKGGSHPGLNQRVAVRARDLAEFCADHKVPFGDVFGALMLLDAQSTSVWVDTVHPTMDGATAALNALRYIFRQLGVSANPYYIRPYRCAKALGAPADGLVPFTTSQPDYDVHNRLNDNHFDLEAIRVRDEYARIAAADGVVVESDAPIVLKFGVGEASAIAAAQVEVVVTSQTSVRWFDWADMQWRDLAAGQGKIAAALSKDVIAKAWRDRAIWLALVSEGKVALDYAAVTLDGDVKPFTAHPSTGPIVWPVPGDLDWPVAGNLIRNGDLTAAEGAAPAHWQPRGRVRYMRPGAVASGVGEFVARRRVDTFKCAGQRFTETVRPLDVLVVGDGPKSATGRFIIAEVLADDSLCVRRYPKEPVQGLKFEVVRSSGCNAVPNAGWLQCRGAGGWETVVRVGSPGRYRLGFFHRAYAPCNMKARTRPGSVGAVSVSAGGDTLAQSDALESSCQWQHAWLEFDLHVAGDVAIRAAATGEAVVEYTGFALVKE